MDAILAEDSYICLLTLTDGTGNFIRGDFAGIGNSENTQRVFFILLRIFCPGTKVIYKYFTIKKCIMIYLKNIKD